MQAVVAVQARGRHQVGWVRGCVRSGVSRSGSRASPCAAGLVHGSLQTHIRPRVGVEAATELVSDGFGWGSGGRVRSLVVACSGSDARLKVGDLEICDTDIKDLRHNL